MYFDGSLQLGGTGAGIVLVAPISERLKYVLWIHFQASNNTAEYEALLHGLRLAISLGIHKLMVWGDFQLVVSQVSKGYSCNNRMMEAYCQEVRKLEDQFIGLGYIMSFEETMKRRTSSQRWDPVEALCPLESLLTDQPEPGGENFGTQVLVVEPEWTKLSHPKIYNFGM